MPTSKNNQISFKGQHFYIGIDMHKKRWVVTIRHNGLSLNIFSTDPSPEGIKRHLENHYPGGIYHLAYEVGFSGFWICRRFHELRLDCQVQNSTRVKNRIKGPLYSNGVDLPDHTAY